MGNKSSFAGLTEEMLDDYASLTYLSKHEILSLLKKLYSIGRREMDEVFLFRFPCEVIEDIFPNLKYNPFKDRIFKVFSSKQDKCFSFEDVLDFFSVMSADCPDEVKAQWAFKIFDVNEDKEIDEHDIIEIIRRLTFSNGAINIEDMRYIAQTLLQTMDIQNTGSISKMEFQHAVAKMSEFTQTFSCSI